MAVALRVADETLSDRDEVRVTTQSQLGEFSPSIDCRMIGAANAVSS